MRTSYQSLYEFGYSFFSPILNHYLRKALKHPNDPQIVCLAREGWIFYTIINHLLDRSLIELEHKPVYLKVSRTLLFRSQLGEEDSWDISLTGKFEGTVLSLLMQRFGLQLHEIFSLLPEELLGFKLSLPADKKKFIQWITPHNEKLRMHAEPTLEALLSYFATEKLTTSIAEPLMLDLGYAGTIQKIITKLIKKDTSGLYFIANDAGAHKVCDNNAVMQGVFRENVKWSEGYLMLERSLLLESLMTAPHGQVIDIRRQTDGEFTFFYGRKAAPQRYYQDLECIITGATDGVAEGFLKNIEYSVQEIEELYAGFALSPSAIPKEVHHLFNIDDAFSGNGVLNPTQLFGL